MGIEMKQMRADAEQVLRYLIELDEPHAMLQFNDGEPSDVEGLSGKSAAEALRTAVELGWVEGQSDHYGGGFYLWSHLHVTVDGMRHAEAWPRLGREHLRGPWTEGHWGRTARPCLEQLDEDPAWGEIPASFGLGPATDGHRRWLALRLLALAGYIDATVDASTVVDARLTLQGRRALADPASPIDAIRALVADRDITRALIDLVDGVIAEHVDHLAARHDVDLLDRNGRELTKIRQRVDRLATSGALDDVDAAILRVALAARNHVGHTVTEAIVPDASTVAWIVEGVAGVLERSEQLAP